MPGVVVVTDSNAYLPRRLAEVNGLHVLQQYVHYADGRAVHDEDVDLEQFFDELRSAEQLPTTSHPTVDDFIAVYQPLLDDGCEIVSIHSSRGLSQTVAAAREACERLEADDRIKVLNEQGKEVGRIFNLGGSHALVSCEFEGIGVRCCWAIRVEGGMTHR